MEGQPESVGLFCAPQEPVFNLRSYDGMKVQLLEQWLITLANDNSDNMNQASHKQGYFKSGDCAEFLFLTCNKLNLGAEAKYLAMELLDKFMVKHIQDLYAHILSIDGSKVKKERDWNAIVDRVRSQVPLRIISCCQIASKLTSHYKIISPRKVKKTLEEFGHSHNLRSILQSELRILKTLNYKVMLNSPLVYLETILEILGHNEPATDVKSYHGVSLNVLDLIYIRREQIYNDLYNLVAKQCTPTVETRRKFSRAENDNMLLAVAVITVVSYLLDQRKTNMVVEGLHRITRIPSENILDFATIIVQHIVDRGGVKCFKY